MGAALETVGLTPRMRDCFVAIETHIAAHGCSPSLDQLRAALDLRSKGHVTRMVFDLQARGWITFQPGKQRSIAIVPGVTTGQLSYVLPPNVALALRDFCARNGEDPNAIVADAVTLFLDDAQPRVAG